ncbi:uncharacterized protein PSANT_03844 [Moesziomyces antarcticus]|nr:uncharacterized protein PSANT_03844 [Moesziomyces antarcticus]
MAPIRAKALLVFWCYLAFSAGLEQALVPFPALKPALGLPSFDFTVTKVGRASKTTITPAPVPIASTATQTVVTTSTDLPVTDTSTVSTTPRVTQTDTATATQTVTVDGETVTVTQTSTSTVPTADGFTPVASQIVAAGAQPFRRALPTIAADQHFWAKGAPKSPVLLRIGQQSNLKNKSVACNKVVEVVKERIAIGFLQKTRTITAAPQTTTRQTMLTATSTVTVAPPRVSVTETSTAPTSTSTVSTTTTQTETASTLATATTTAYTVRAINNLVSRIDSRPIDGGGLNGDIAGINAASAMEGCEACQRDTRCQPSFFYATTACYLFIADTCPAPHTAYLSDGNEVFTISNGRCGSIGMQ